MTKATLGDAAEYLGAIVFLRAARLFPTALLPNLSRLLGTLAFDVFGYRRGVALSNLMRHLPRDGLSRSAGPGNRAYKSIGREAMQSFVMGLAEFARLPLVDAAYIEKHIAIAGLANLDEALRRGRGAVLITGHFGSWEIPGCALARLGYPVDLVVGMQHNRLVQNLMNDLRRSCGIGIIEPGNLLRAVRSLEANRFVAMLSDQDAGRNGVFVDFLGERASTPRGAAHLSILAGSPIIPGFIVRTAGCRHRMVIEDPISPPEIISKEGVAELTQVYTRLIEMYVRRYPSQWLWSHRRWKTRPA
jgi:KDO2-lipid IV(A) lauroyltransferase